MIKYKISTKNPHSHILTVKLTLDNPNPLGQVFMLPNWIPGSYLIRDFSKNIISINAKSCAKNILIKKLDKNHWISHPCEKSITLEYEVYAFDKSVRSAYLDDKRAFFNGSSVFLSPLGFEDEKREVKIKPFNNFKIATSLDYKNGFYYADNYESLIDNPVEIADFDKAEFEVKSIPHKIVITGRHNADLKKIKTDLEKICKYHVDFFGELLFDKYLFLTLATNNDYGGLEHKKSCALICATDELLAKNKEKYANFLSLCSHEYFHTWWIKTIKPANFFNLDLSRENYTEQLWIFEGFTSYYDELSLLRTKLLTKNEYLKLLAQKITKVQKSAGRFKQSLADSSFDCWTNFYQKNENAPNAIVSYYSKGALLAFILDIKIRKLTNNEKSLDDVLKYIWNNFKQAGLENNTVQKVLEKLTKTDFSQFFADYLYDVKELPLIESFGYLGIDCSFSHKKNDLSAFGLETNKDLKITTIFENSCAQLAGLYVNDKIITINSVKVKFENLASIIESFAKNTLVEVGVLRDDILKQIKIKIFKNSKHSCTLIVKNKQTQKIRTRREKWFYS